MSYLDWAPCDLLPSLKTSSERSLGCECGAGMHEGETHEAALACEIVEASTGCDCGGYYDHETGEVVHDGYCALSPWPVYTMKEIDETRAWSEDYMEEAQAIMSKSESKAS